MVEETTPRQKTEKELKKEAEKAAKLAKFEEKQKKLADQKAKAVASNKPAKETKAKKDPAAAKEELVDTTNPGDKKILGEIPSAYNPSYVESAWYAWWEKKGYFKPEYVNENAKDSDPESFTICIPPPNVTGTLHVGHALATTVEDTITRWNRMHGKRTLFNPGCDHAGIATQVVVEKRLKREKGLTRHDLGRDKFNQEVWHWKNQKGDVIYDQFRKLGASVDWDRAVFTMDPKMCRAVTEAFIRMHDMGSIYRSNRLVNWSCALRSAISDIEVDKKEFSGATLISVPGYENKVEFGVLSSFAYKIHGSEEEIVVSTTRIETMLGDSAVAVHPDDQRYKHLVGKKCVHPFIPHRELPIVSDTFVEMGFGTGAVKITPAHDHNDYEVGLRQKLPFHTCITDEGMIAEGCGQFSGMKRFDARIAVIEALKEKGLFRGKEDNPMVVPTCSRSKDVIEPILKPQWYVKCTHMAEKAMKAVETGELKIIPDFHVATWNRWLESSRDWCISRQLWWGHRIPAYYVTFTDGKIREQSEADEQYWVSAHTEDEARAKASKKFGVDPKDIRLKWDEDVLDTWFSSGMWPFAIFGWPEPTKDLDLFFPSAVLETGHDILFFWVARMVFMSQELTGKLPFKEILLHAMIRDAHGRKMSKSLGNVIDPLDVIRGVTLEGLHAQLVAGNLDEKEIAVAKAGQARDYPEGIPECGTDALRFALLAYTSQGRDINLDVLRVQGYRFFCNKIWQAVRFTLSQFTGEEKPTYKFDKSKLSPVDKWVLSRLSYTVKECNRGMKEYNFTQVTTAVYNFWLYDFCDVFIEAIKPVLYGKNPSARQIAISVLYQCVDTGLRLISPLMPFISEELWQRLPRLDDSDYTAPSVIVAPYPKEESFPYEDAAVEEAFAFAKEVVTKVRSLRADYDLTVKTKISMHICVESEKDKKMLVELTEMIETLTWSKSVSIISADKKATVPHGCAQVAMGSRGQIFIDLTGIIDIAKEIEKLATKLSKNEIAIKKISDAQGSGDYETKVPLGIRTRDQEKKTSLEKEIESITAAIAQLKALN